MAIFCGRALGLRSGAFGWGAMVGTGALLFLFESEYLHVTNFLFPDENPFRPAASGTPCQTWARMSS